MAQLNALLRAVVHLVNRPLEGLTPFWGVLLWSIPIAVFALVVFKKTSQQDRIAAVKEKIYACLFEIRLFNDDLRAILRAQGEIFRHVLTYQRLSLVPMVWILPPLVLIMVHLHTYYGFRPLRPGDHVLLKVSLADDWRERLGLPASESRPPVELEAPAGVSVETPAVWLDPIAEIVWRVGVTERGDYELGVVLDGQRYGKRLQAGEGTVPVSFERPSGSSFLAQLEWPAEPPLPAKGPIRSITVAHPPADFNFFGLDMEWEFGWMVAFFVWTMVFALALRKRMGVEF